MTFQPTKDHQGDKPDLSNKQSGHQSHKPATSKPIATGYTINIKYDEIELLTSR